MSNSKFSNVKEFLIELNQQDVIIGIIPEDALYVDAIGQPIESLLGDQMNAKYQTFKDMLQKDKLVINFKMKLRSNHQCFFNGYMDHESLFIIVLFQSMSDQDILKKMMMLNSQQLNEIRRLYKYAQMNDVAYEQISKLNNELLNSKRTIEKQNAQLQKYNELLKKMAIEDSLTGCFNRRHFYDYMRENVLSSQRDETKCLINIDFNHFKMINDQFGHDAGDRLLVQFVKITQNQLKEEGTVFRIGGDEFILLTNHQNVEEATKMMDEINQHFFANTKIASLAFGIVLFNISDINHEFELSNLVKTSDERMYAYKVNHRGD